MADPPPFGILLSRAIERNSRSAGKHRFEGLTVDGSWRRAAVYCVSSENNAFFAPRIDNAHPGAEASLYLAHRNYLGVESGHGSPLHCLPVQEPRGRPGGLTRFDRPPPQLAPGPPQPPIGPGSAFARSPLAAQRQRIELAAFSANDPSRSWRQPTPLHQSPVTPSRTKDFQRSVVPSGELLFR